ncbi:MAG: response regulator transcription factor [bacterium]|nr:response regulator transcription factor [bacterium]
MIAPKVLVATPDLSVQQEIERHFSSAGFRVVTVPPDQDALPVLKKENPRAFVVDYAATHGKIDEINRLLRETNRKTALVVLTGSRKSSDRISALENGADECLSGTEAFEELVAKVKALIRRIDLVDTSPNTIQIKDIEINLETHEVMKNGRPVDLTYTQFKLLYLLVTHRDTIFSREEILGKVWGENVYVTDRTVDVHVKRLREKLGEKTNPSRYIQTIHGMGYRFA